LSIEEAEQEEAAAQQLRQQLSRQLSRSGSASRKGSTQQQELSGAVTAVLVVFVSAMNLHMKADVKHCLRAI
jgi:hypothetical protein